MNQNDTELVSRRAALQGGIALGMGLVVFASSGASTMAPNKLTKESVKYTDAGTERGKDCDDCSQYQPAASAAQAPTCRIVDGPISAHGHCIAFSPKPKT